MNMEGKMIFCNEAVVDAILVMVYELEYSLGQFHQHAYVRAAFTRKNALALNF